MKIAVILSLLLTIACLVVSSLRNRLDNTLNLVTACVNGDVDRLQTNSLLEKSSAYSDYVGYMLMGILVVSSFLTGWIIKIQRKCRVSDNRQEA